MDQFHDFNNANPNPSDEPEQNKNSNERANYMNSLAGTTAMLQASSHYGSSVIDSEYAGFEETEESTISYYRILSIALCAGFAVNFLTAKFFAPTINVSNSYALLIIYVVCAIVGSIMMHKGTTLTSSIVAYALFVIPLGICITPAVTLYYPSNVVTTAFLGTTVITVGMIGLSFLYPNAFLSMGRALIISLLLSLVASIFCAIFAPGVLTIIDYAVVLIFGLYIGYDVVKARNYPKNPYFAIRAAADLYLDIINIFLRLLSILGNSRSRR